MSDNYIVVDLGASNGRVIVADVADGKISFDVVHRFDNVPVFCNEEEFCWDILRIYSDIKEGIRIAVGKYPGARSIGIDTMGCDFGFIDDQGRLIGNPVYFRDQRQHLLSGEMHEILPEEELFALSQGPCNRIMGIYKLYQLKKYKRFEYEHGAHLLMMPDLLNYLLTGKISNEFTNATMTLMVNQKDRCWEEKIFDKLGFRKDIFTRLSEPGTVLEPVKESVCKELGIPPIPIVIPATHDTASAVAGIPVTSQDKKWGFVSLGTWALSGMERDEPLTNPEVVAFEFGNEGGVFGKSMLLKNINGLWVIQQCRKYWQYELGRDVGWGEICEAAMAAPDRDCVFNCDDLEFTVSQQDMPGTIRGFMEKTGQYVPQSMGEVARCVFKSLACRIDYSFGKVLDTIGEKMELLHILGGGTQNRLLCQWIANAMGIPVVAGPVETTAVGNLLFQLIADGKVSTLEEGRALCAASSELMRYEPRDQDYWVRTKKYYREALHI